MATFWPSSGERCDSPWISPILTVFSSVASEELLDVSSLSLEALVVASVVVVVAEVELFVELSSLLVFVTSAGSEVEAVVSSATTVRALLKPPNWLANKVATANNRIFFPYSFMLFSVHKNISSFIIREWPCVFKRFQKYFSKRKTLRPKKIEV